MAQIRMTNGYASFQEWASDGYPGAVSFDRDGNRKDAPKTKLHRAVHQDCAVAGCQRVGSAPQKLCWMHYHASVIRRERASA